jgi:hypothetical protein
MRKTILTAALAALVLSAGVALAGAVDVPVYYDVDAKALKDGAPAGTMLTLELHALSDCSDAAVHSEMLAIEALKVEAPKTVTPKNADKGAKVNRLTAILTGVQVPENAFLKVTGSGITPVGGDCQAQPISSGATGASGPTGPVGPTGPAGLAGVDFGFLQANGAGFETSANLWSRVAMFLYPGTQDAVLTSAVAIVYTTNASTSYRLRIVDVTNGYAVVAMSPPSNSGTFVSPGLVPFGAIFNLPAAQAVFELQVLATDETGSTGVPGRQAVGVVSMQAFYQ